MVNSQYACPIRTAWCRGRVFTFEGHFTELNQTTQHEDLMPGPVGVPDRVIGSPEQGRGGRALNGGGYLRVTPQENFHYVIRD